MSRLKVKLNIKDDVLQIIDIKTNKPIKFEIYETEDGMLDADLFHVNSITDKDNIKLNSFICILNFNDYPPIQFIKVDNLYYLYDMHADAKREIWNGFEGLLATSIPSISNGILHRLRKSDNVLEEVLSDAGIPLRIIQYSEEDSIKYDIPKDSNYITDGVYIESENGAYDYINDASYLVMYNNIIKPGSECTKYIYIIILANNVDLELVSEKIKELINK